MSEAGAVGHSRVRLVCSGHYGQHVDANVLTDVAGGPLLLASQSSYDEPVAEVVAPDRWRLPGRRVSNWPVPDI
jgi:hypothetical protein